MTAASPPALLPCPFCNAAVHPAFENLMDDPETDEVERVWTLLHLCPVLLSTVSAASDTQDRCHAAWNRRDGTAELVEALEELLGRYTGASAKWGKSANEATIAKALAALAKHGGGT